MAKWLATTVITVGILFVLVGVMGFVDNDVLRLHMSPAHNILHIVSGIITLYFGLSGTLAAARLFCIVFGGIYALLGVIGFVLGAPGMPTVAMVKMGPTSHLLKVIPGVLELGTSDHVFHILLGGTLLLAGLLTKAGIHKSTATSGS